MRGKIMAWKAGDDVTGEKKKADVTGEICDTVFSVRWNTYFLVNRVEHQKLNQTTPYTVFTVR